MTATQLGLARAASFCAPPAGYASHQWASQAHRHLAQDYSLHRIRAPLAWWSCRGPSLT